MSRTKKEIYPSDLSDAQWEVVAPVLRQAVGRGGRISRRAVLNAIFYVHRTGCQWRFLPKGYPKWKTVYSCFWRWQRSGAWDVGRGLGDITRGSALCSGTQCPSDSAASVDSQSIKSTEKGGLVAMTAPKKCADVSG